MRLILRNAKIVVVYDKTNDSYTIEHHCLDTEFSKSVDFFLEKYGFISRLNKTQNEIDAEISKIESINDKNTVTSVFENDKAKIIVTFKGDSY